ncbi:MAG: hypothetical protein AAGG47_20030, partial [Pseudomonadota bacterium]
AVLSLVARLRAGLGENLAGVSEDARIIALDWADNVENGTDGTMRDRRKRLFDWEEREAARGH